MQKPLKILVVRFSSIGDIVLTTPVVRCLKNQLGAEVHFLTKSKYREILDNNSYINKVHTINNKVSSILDDLKKENYDYIIDLHNNLRSNSLFKLKVPTHKIYKSNFKKFLLIKFGVNFLSDQNVVDRYMKTIEFLSVRNDKKGLDYFIDSNISVDFNINQKFIAWSIAAGHDLKKLSTDQVVRVSDKINLPIILLGGEKDREQGDKIIKRSTNINIHNFCGSLSLDQSSYLIKKSQLVLTNDTGLMHIACAFRKKIISFWGCTKPSLGFAPYMTDSSSIEIISDNSSRPCSKHGKFCRYQPKVCIQQIDPDQIYQELKALVFRK